MAFNNDLPEWKPTMPDERPAQSKINEGFVAGERPTAAVWNWFANRTAKAIKDLIDNAVHKDQAGKANGFAPLGEDLKVESKYLPDNVNFDNHLKEMMPHKFVDGGKTYRWGFRTVNGEPQMIYEEVV